MSATDEAVRAIRESSGCNHEIRIETRGAEGVLVSHPEGGHVRRFSFDVDVPLAIASWLRLVDAYEENADER